MDSVTAGVLQAPKFGMGPQGGIKVTDKNGKHVESGLTFRLEAVTCSANGDPADGTEVFTEADLSVFLPVTAPIETIEYKSTPEDTWYTLTESGTLLAELMDCQQKAQQAPIPIGLHLISGNPLVPDDKAFVIVCVGDAFKFSQLGDPGITIAANPGVTASESIADMFHFLLDHDPIREYRNLIKIYRLDFVSQHDQMSDPVLPDCTNSYGYTAFNTYDYHGGFYYDDITVTPAVALSGLAADRMMVFTNGVKPEETNLGGTAHITNSDDNRHTVALHEFGHMFRLVEEYEVDHGLCNIKPCKPFDPTQLDPPITKITNATNAIWFDDRIPTFAEIPWNRWLQDPATAGAGCPPSYLGVVCTDDALPCPCSDPVAGCITPLPTCEPGGNRYQQSTGHITGTANWPEPQDPDAVVGLFEGADKITHVSYRPQLRCRMRSGDDTENDFPYGAKAVTLQFCTVCREIITLYFLEASGIVRQATPDTNSTATYVPSGPAVAFHVDLPVLTVPSHPFSITWKLNGVVVATDQQDYEFLPPPALSGPQTITAEVTDATPWLNANYTKFFTSKTADNIRTETITWQLSD